MVRKRTGVLEWNLSRRDILRGLAGFVLAISLETCAQTLSTSSSTPTSTPAPHHPGSLLYTYRGHKDRIPTVAWSPNGNYIASGSADNTSRVWEVASGNQLYIYPGHTGAINSIAWSPDSQHIASGSIDKKMSLC